MGFIDSIEWLSLINTLGTLAALLIAWTALNTWRSQKKADIHTSYLDELTDEVHELIFKLSPALEFLKYIQMSFKSHMPYSDPTQEHHELGAIAYIERTGPQDSEKFNEYLKECEPHVAKIRSMAAKGQALGLLDFDKCNEACQTITWLYEQLISVRVMIALQNLNWENEQARKSLRSVLQIDHETIRKKVEDQNTVYLNFVKANYGSLLKIT